MSDSDIATAQPASASSAAAAEEVSPPPPPSPPSDPTSHPPPSEMEETVHDPLPTEARKEASPAPNVAFSIWPPSQRTRDAVVARLIETLSAPSVLSKRYGTVPQDEAASAARAIEEEAFNAAGGAAAADDDGIEVLQIYSKEISKRMLDSVKARASLAAAASPAAAPDSAAAPSPAPTPGGDAAAPAANEETSSTVESEA
ncbi:MFP1 attachment factor 1-like [Syzygium oleosum]|uniref:MFP1 attachment factor 1-like n=1 Tax=Syzygium oleosum TaxID=219896 RepID=UPI0024B8EB44|nr:MFP1 attachment factor 1-like [Syzygium oleosum]